MGGGEVGVPLSGVPHSAPLPSVPSKGVPPPSLLVFGNLPAHACHEGQNPRPPPFPDPSRVTSNWEFVESQGGQMLRGTPSVSCRLVALGYHVDLVLGISGVPCPPPTKRNKSK